MRIFAGIVVILVASVVVSCSSSSHDSGTPPATHLYAFTVEGNDVSPAPSALYELNPTTGEFVKFVGTLAYAVNGCDWDRHGGRLLATTTYWDEKAPSVLIQVNPATADATMLGTTSPQTLVNLAANSAGALYSWTESSDDLVSLSTTGVAHVFASSGLSTWGHSLKFDSTDRLWFVNGNENVYLMDYVTGLPSTVGNLGNGTYEHHGDFHPDTGRFWSISDTSNPRDFVIASLDPVLVHTTLRAPDNVHCIAFRK